MSLSKVIHLIVGDHAARVALHMPLESEGYTVKTHPSVRSCLATIEQTDSGCILMDVRLPEMDGLDLLAVLTERGINMPAIVMSGLTDPKLEITARRQGAIDFLETPVDPEVLLAAIRSAFSRCHSRGGYRQIREGKISPKKA